LFGLEKRRLGFISVYKYWKGGSKEDGARLLEISGDKTT